MHKKRFFALLLLTVMMVSLLTGCCLSHDWQEATCTTPKVCTKCGKAEGDAQGHIWEAATAYTHKKCSTCGEMDIAAILPFLASEHNATYNAETNELVIKSGRVSSEYDSYWEYIQKNVYDDHPLDIMTVRTICMLLGLEQYQAENLLKTTEKDGAKTMTGSYSNSQQTLSVTSKFSSNDGLCIIFRVE